MQEERCRIINALECVDCAYLVNSDITNDKLLALKQFHFDVLFSGDDWKGSERYNKTEKDFAELGVSIEYLPYTNGVSTSKIKEELKTRN